MIDILGGKVIDAIGDAVDKIFTSDEERKQLDLEEKKLETQIDTALIDYAREADTGQMEVNRAEARSGNIFVAGWRPAVGWICAAGLGYQFLFYPLFSGLFPELKSLDVSLLTTLLMAMLGMGGLRTFEKFKNVEQNR